MVGHREFVPATEALEDIHKRFAQHEYEYMAVLDGDRLVGLCTRRQVGMVLGARFGFAIYSRKPIGDGLMTPVTAIRVGQPISEVLNEVFSRPDENLFDDVALLDEKGAFLGLIFARTLSRLQNSMLLEKIGLLNLKNEQMQEDLLLAREIQLALLPQVAPRIPEIPAQRSGSLAFQHFYQPAGQVSGDFFHILRLSDTAAGVFICDVMGHGVRSAFVTAMLRALVQELRRWGENPAELLTRVNAELKSILQQTKSPMFATAFYLVADVRQPVVRYARAGHPSPLHLRWNEGRVVPLPCAPGTSGPALGLYESARYGNNECPFTPGDTLVLYTDGIPEALNDRNEEFGEDRLRAAIWRGRSLPLKELIVKLVDEARAFAADQAFQDDVCVVGLEITGF